MPGADGHCRLGAQDAPPWCGGAPLMRRKARPVGGVSQKRQNASTALGAWPPMPEQVVVAG